MQNKYKYCIYLSLLLLYSYVEDTTGNEAT